jgi:hypothetical protein
MALIALGAMYYMVSALNAATQRTAADRVSNAQVLYLAKQALIGWVAANVLDSSENNPGKLPCPQAWGDVGSSNEGRAAATCAQPAIGWLPWRTLGLPLMRDAAGEQLWYAISPGWHLPNGSTLLSINSDTAGQLVLDGQTVVALIVAPGRALNIAPDAAQLAAGCVARNQSRATNLPAVAPNVLDYLECANGSAADYTYATNVVNNAVNAVFNDQVAAVTVADILPALEAAIAKRIERDIVPELQGVYVGPQWGLSPGSRLYPFAAPFANPGPGAGTSNFLGVSGIYQGLLPFSQSQGCTIDPSNPRCMTSLSEWSTTPSPQVTQIGGVARPSSYACAWETSDLYVCTGEYQEGNPDPTEPITLRLSAKRDSVAMGLRTFTHTDPSPRARVYARDDVLLGPWNLVSGSTASVALAADGSATITLNGGLMPNIDAMGWGTYANFRIEIDRSIITDHALLDSSNPTTGWFVRNEWYRLLYYAVAQGHTAANLPALACTSGTDCITLGNDSNPDSKRALVLLAGRSLANPGGRPNATLGDYVEGTNADLDQVFEKRVVNSTYNDRAVVIDQN